MGKYAYLLFSLLFIVFFLGNSLIGAGGIFVLDFVITPFTQSQNWYATTIQWHIVDMINYLLGYSYTSKIYYIFIFIFGLFTAAKLGNIISKLISGNTSLWFIQSVTAIFLLCNPWTYERLMTQPGIVLGMFSIALGISSLLEHILSPRKYSLIGASIAFGLSFMFFPHASILILLILLVYIALFWKIITWKYYFIAPICIIVPNINWLIGSIWFGSDIGINTIHTFDWENIQGFVGNSLSGLGVEITHILLYGFWGERFHILTPDRFITYWYIFGIIVLIFIICGNIILYRLHKKIWFFLTSIALISFVLSLGISSSLFNSFNTWLYTHIDWYIAMREPQKWLGLTMISYSIFFIITIISLKQKFIYIGNIFFIFLVFILLNTWNPMNILAYKGQLRTMVLPKEYAQFVDSQSRLQHDVKYLVLPWHSYMACSWTRGKIIASMQDRLFYPLDTIVADNLEIITKYSNSTSLSSKHIENFLQTRDISFLKRENIQSIIIQKGCVDTSEYEFLSTIPKLKLHRENSALLIYNVYYE